MVLVATTHYLYYPSQVVLLAPDGRVLREYWHSGHLNHLQAADLDNDGRTEFYLAGINNAWHAATLVVLDQDHFAGASQEPEAPDHQLLGFPPGAERSRIIFPRSCLNTTFDPYNPVATLSVNYGEIVVQTMELIGPGAGIFHHLSPDFRQHRAVISDSYLVEYQRAKAAGQLSASCTPDESSGPPHPPLAPPCTKSAYTVGMRRLAPIATLFLLSLPAIAARQIALITDGELAPPARHGLAKLQEALRAKGFEIAASAAQADYVILAGIGPSATLQEWKAPVPAGREALTIWRGRYRNKPAIALRGGDARGLMYAALDTADRIAWSSADPFQYVRNTTEKPYLAERGISMYTMQRAYFESRLYDEAHWKRYFDMLAADRINSFVVIFGYENGGFMAPLYPYFFDVKEFPDVEMVGHHQAASRSATPRRFKP